MGERRSPHGRGNGLAVVLAFEGAKWLDSDIEEGAADVVEGEEADERAERCSIHWKGPIGNQIKLRLSGAVAIRSDVVTNVLDAVGKELAFLKLECDTVFHEDVADALEQTKQSSKDRSPQKDVVDDDATAKVSGISGVTRFVQRLPFTFEDAHHAGVESRSVARAERHDTETIFFIVGCKESKLLLVAASDHNLVVPGLVVKGDKEQTAGGVAEIVDSVVATRDRIFER